MNKSKNPETVPFSQQLQNWMDSDNKKTIEDLQEVFDEKSFALAFFILLSIPALPLPTGGVTHLFEVIAMLLALELIAQRESIWLPKRWRNKEVGPRVLNKSLPRLIKLIRKTERFSKHRMAWFLETRISRTLFGVAILILSLVAFFAPPFTGLDTLPAMGVLGISLGVILKDIFVVIIGIVIGTTGAFLSIGLGATVVELIGRLF